MTGNIIRFFKTVFILFPFLMLIFTGCSKSGTLVLSGTVESTQIDVNSEVAGKIIVINKDEGIKVAKGDILATVDSSLQELVVKQQEAMVLLKQARLEELKEGPAAQAIQVTAAAADLDQAGAALEQAKLVLSRYGIKSPVDGIYLLKNINIGDMVNIGTSIGTISDLTDLWVRVYISQRNINSVSLNQEVDLKTISLQGKVIKGKITFIASEAEFTPRNIETNEAKENTVFKLKVKIIDNIESLKPGMTVDIYIPIGGKPA